MIEETATVVSKSNEKIVIETLQKSSCGSCSVNKACGTGIISNYIKPKANKFSIDNTINADVGDTIIVGIHERVFLFGSFLLYILPLIFIFSFALVGEYIANLFVLNNTESFVILMSITGFASGFVLVRYLLKNKLNLLKFNPKLIRKINLKSMEVNIK